MTAPAFNSVAWFEIGTGRPDDVQSFYADLFDWTFGPADADYREVTAPGADAPSGGVFSSGGAFPDYAIFYVVVRDVQETVTRAESLGAKILVPPRTTDRGLTFAQLHDPTGHHFGVFSPPAV
ncbi:VOC family protein [Actinomadura flavalba]|uniref:VOC family protein n=1 Tax=Actinomadura flavalba TaxID=1120938 RepID=UPI000380133B|nr:VOC family protein [Actinomadura flavalba]